MAKRKDIENTGGEAAATPDGAPEQPPAKNEINSDLPTVESPPISPGSETPAICPGTPELAIGPVASAAPASAPEIEASDAPAPPARPRFSLKARHKRHALLAASVALAAALGAVIGALASGGFGPPARTDVAGLEESKAMQQSIARLGKEITTLKASIESANKSAHTQIAKITDKITDKIPERLDHPANPETTGSIPTPRPAPGIAAVENRPPARPPVVKDWSIRDARDGFVYVQGHGDIYQVVPGAPLPGLGPVQSIKRQDGRWVVTTPKGIIVSMRDRHYFE